MTVGVEGLPNRIGDIPARHVAAVLHQKMNFVCSFRVLVKNLFFMALRHNQNQIRLVNQIRA